MKENIQQYGLFSDQELDNLDGNLFAEREHAKSVTCLGMVFESDEARREYFRAELRKKLPELRHIDGFPIGKDDDIIALSDPPYYTACPNPWLNDFIAQWEAEKADLETRGLRTPDFEVKEPYAADVSEGKNNPIYMAHAYHTKVPHPAIMRYILHYTQPGDIVFDGFCGTGMTGVAANICADRTTVVSLNEKNIQPGFRHSICSDLSPIATLISASYNTEFDVIRFEEKALSILRQVEEEFGWMYETINNGTKAKINYVIWSDFYSCPNCGSSLNLWENSVSSDTKTLSPNFPCPKCGSDLNKKNLVREWETDYDGLIGQTTRLYKSAPCRINGISGTKRFEHNATSYDNDLLERVKTIYSDTIIHTGKILIGDESKRIENYGISHLHQFYTLRCFIILSKIYELVKDDVHLLAWFTSTLLNLTKMYKFRTDRKGSMLYGTLYIPSLRIEFNPLRTLASKISDFKRTFYGGRGNSIISLNSATKLATIQSNSIDYIFTDPPFGANLMYSELNSIWENWLRIETDNQTEAIVNDSQNKSLFEYQSLMNASLKEFYRVLKPGKWLTMEFSNTSAAVWNSIQTALQGVGFVIANVSALDKQQGSFKAVTTTTAVKQDLIITCYKPTDELTQKFQNSSDIAANVWDFVNELLEHLPVHVVKEQKTTTIVERSPKILFDRVIAYYVQHGYPVPLNALEFQKGLRDRFIELDGMFFTAPQAAEYKDKKREAPEMLPMGLIVSDEANGIEWLKIELKTPQTYQEIQPKWLQAVDAVRKNDIIPELRQLLEENFIEEANGKWRLPNVQDDKDVAALRTKVLLREFKLYVEQASKPRGKIKEARVEALRAGFKQCYIDRDFQTIVMVGDRIPANLRDEDEVLLQFYDIALNKI